MSWAVVIPSARAANLVRSVESLIRTHPGAAPSRICVVDDGAREEAEAKLPRGILWVEGIKPFIYARNINLGVERIDPADPVILMGDDVEVLTEHAFDRLEATLAERKDLGILSPGILGIVGNVRQNYRRRSAFQLEHDKLAFVCVAIPQRVRQSVGKLDERFAGYGCEDDDYSWRVREAGFKLGILHTCAVRHDGSIPSTFRTRPDYEARFRENRERLALKWSDGTPCQL